ncbi:hypothetical protein F1559_000604 [Cyanidiococcus yangmingshanensis]|uniref:CRAL-TRIO domain-containing protein n=1 Tax=Cyanidiococcus yangmingshanensis TaxID=2690220 RepID=A0A7J7IQ13_9RHOD|nr:hypothetical protein F1559_000604 [Cyanidiococcus yangmingshanensis]
MQSSAAETHVVQSPAGEADQSRFARTVSAEVYRQGGQGKAVTVAASLDLSRGRVGRRDPDAGLGIEPRAGAGDAGQLRKPKGLPESDSQSSLPGSTKGDGKRSHWGAHRHISYHKHPLVVEVLRAAASSDTPYRRHAAYDYVRILPRVTAEDEPIIVILGKNMPYHQYELEISVRFLFFVMHVAALSQRQKYRLVYVHRQESSVSGPGLHWLLLAFRQMPRRATRLLSALVVVNANVLLYLSRWTILPFLNYRVWRKLRFGGVLDDLRLQDHPHIVPLLNMPKRRGRARPLSPQSISPPISATVQSPRTETGENDVAPEFIPETAPNHTESTSPQAVSATEQTAILVSAL